MLIIIEQVGERDFRKVYICESASGNDCQSVSVCPSREVQLV